LLAVKNVAWPHTPIDTFILAKLEEKDLSPAAPADKATLLRRATFDLHGLPPTPAELEAFNADKSSDAFAKVVDRLLASPRYGERWGRHWLDLARFAESDGFEYDRLRENAWRYRDYVVTSFNQDKPYAQFIKEQIAGDALEFATAESVAATGFLVAGPYDAAGNTSVSVLLKARIREEELEDIIAAVSQTFLGMTVNCARCHDHKFDPIPQRDYYQIKAALEGVRHGERPLLSAAQANARQTRVAQLNERIHQLEKEIAAIESAGRVLVTEASATPNFNAPEGAPARINTSNGSAPVPVRPIALWRFKTNADDAIGALHGTLHGGATLQRGRLHLDGKEAFLRTAPLTDDLREKTLEAWLVLPNLAQRGGGVVSLETPDGGVFDALVFGEREPKKWMAGSNVYRRTRDLNAPFETAGSNELVHVAAVYGSDNSITFYRNGAPYGQTYTPAGDQATVRTYARGDAHLLFGLRHTGASNGFLEADIDEVRLYDRALSAEQIAISARSGPRIITADAIAQALTEAQRRQRDALLADLAKERKALQAIPPIPQGYAAVSRQPELTFVLARGDVESKRQPVSAGALSAVHALPDEFGLPAEASEGLRRLRLAEWIAHPENPLTPRVLINRVWHYHFGRGLVGTPNDFGANGERPSHPQLLDWLAAEFLAQGGRVKSLHRLIMLSATYQQSSNAENARRLSAKAASSVPTSLEQKLDGVERVPTPSFQGAKVDADNRLLWHFPLRRLEGEAVRDAMLSVSGQLNSQMGGPSYRPFTVFVSNSSFYNLTDPFGPEYDRRTVYRMGVHSGRDPLLDSLDCPDPSTKTPMRGMTTTPIQALGLMNNSFVLRQAHYLAARLKIEAGEKADEQIKQAYRLTLNRSPQEAEIRRAAALAHEHGMESVCWALLNASEFSYVR
jgi:hypothetical protein